MKAKSASHDTADTSLAAPVPGWALLMVGFVLTTLTGYRWGVMALAWVSPVPFLLFARRVRSVKQTLALLGVIMVTCFVQVSKIVSSPVSYAMVPSFATPIALGSAVVLGVTELIRRRSGETWGVFTFASLTALGDWASLALSPLGAWGATGNSQVDSLALLQFASLLGLPGIGFLMGWFQFSLSLLLGSPTGAPQTAPRWRPFAFACAAAGLVLVYGSIRLSMAHGSSRERTVTVAAVVTDLGPGKEGLPSRETLSRNNDDLFGKTRMASARGARLVAWNEVATVVEPAEEAAFVDRGRGMARELGIDLVLAYGVVASRAPLLLDNKFVFITQEGEVAETYRKHHPVPGEPSMRGKEPLWAIDRPYGRVAGAICYDYDFPAMARSHSVLGAELVVVPSSDWAGIDPYHTQMARVRAIEGGFTVFRPVRWASSAAEGRLHADSGCQCPLHRREGFNRQTFGPKCLSITRLSVELPLTIMTPSRAAFTVT